MIGECRVDVEVEVNKSRTLTASSIQSFGLSSDRSHIEMRTRTGTRGGKRRRRSLGRREPRIVLYHFNVRNRDVEGMLHTETFTI